MLNFIHAADFHLDSAFGALDRARAAQRRQENREMLFRLADYVNCHQIDLVLLAGDLFDSGRIFRETGESLAAALEQMNAQVCIAPGNHDWFGPATPWQTVDWADNVHIFRTNALMSVEFPAWNLTVHGAAFTGPEQPDGLLNGFTAPQDGHLHFGLLHGELTSSETPYNPIQKEAVANSGLHYLALGHIHKRTPPLTFGRTLCAWPGCPEGRGFDELGPKGFYQGAVDGAGTVSLTFVPFAQRRYEILEVDVTGQNPRAAVEAALPPDTANHLYRILLTGETDGSGVNAQALQTALADRFYTLDIRDHTQVAQDVWQRADENSLHGLFLRELRNRRARAASDEERTLIDQAVRFGLAALDHREID